jgi:general L-amino acid transport system substrate-binding protein
LAAEEYGINSANIDTDEVQKSTDPAVQKLIGNSAGNGKSLGLTLKEGKKSVDNEKWAYQAIKQVGNYSEIFERNVGPNTPLKLERGLNALWNARKPGLMYAPPLK